MYLIESQLLETNSHNHLTRVKCRIYIKSQLVELSSTCNHLPKSLESVKCSKIPEVMSLEVNEFLVLHIFDGNPVCIHE